MTSYAMIGAIDKLAKIREALNCAMEIHVPFPSDSGGQWWVEVWNDPGDPGTTMVGATLGECADKLEYEFLSGLAK